MSSSSASAWKREKLFVTQLKFCASAIETDNDPVLNPVLNQYNAASRFPVRFERSIKDFMADISGRIL